MFSQIELTNFRAIGPGSLHLALRPLTLLVGENGAGKSSVLQAIALTAQSATEQPRLQDVVVRGSKWAGRELKDLYFRHDQRSALSITLTSQIEGAGWSKNGLPTERPWAGKERWPPTEFAYRWCREGAEPTAWSHYYELDGEHVWDCLGRLQRENGGWQAVQELSILNGRGGMIAGLRPLRSFERVLPESMFLPPGQLFNFGLLAPAATPLGTAAETAWKTQVAEAATQAAAVLGPLSAELRSLLQRVLLIEPLRGQELVSAETGAAQSAGRHGQDLLRLLSTLETRRQRPWEQFRAWAARFGLHSIESGLDADKLNLSAVDQNEITIGLSEFATGSFQGLLLAAQIILAQPESVLLLEEPESNMHPAYEKELASLLADGVLLGHQVIVTTHSEILVAAVASLVRQRKLRPDQVAIQELQRDSQGVTARELAVTERGLSEWVESFTKVEATLSREWADGIPEER